MRAVTYLACREKESWVGAAEVSKAIKVPGAYISKIFQNLVRCGILSSKRGPAGGVSLQRDPKKLSLLEVIEVIDDMEALNECAMGLDRCEDYHSCPLHEVWKKAKKNILKKFEQTKIIELAENPKKFKYGPLRRPKLKSA